MTSLGAAVAAVLVLLVALAVGCGGDERADPAPPPAPTAERRYREGLQDAARRYRRATEAGARRSRNAATTDEAAATSDALIAATRRFVADLRRLRPPGEVAGRHRRLVAAYARAGQAFVRLRAAARARRPDELRRLAAQVSSSSPVFRELAAAGAALRMAGYDVERELRTAGGP